MENKLFLMLFIFSFPLKQIPFLTLSLVTISNDLPSKNQLQLIAAEDILNSTEEIIKTMLDTGEEVTKMIAYSISRW